MHGSMHVSGTLAASSWTSAIQLRLRRLRRACSFSPSKVAGARRSSAGYTFSNALMLTTA
jgi:hypothetical protein